MFTKRALLLGDSLAVPRPHRGQTIDHTWPVILKNEFPFIDIWQRCRAASISVEVLKEFHNFSDSLDAFDFLILQVGIGDCCPRPYPYWLQQLFNTYCTLKTQRKINSTFHRLLKLRSKPWISEIQFCKYFEEMISISQKRNPKIQIFILSIGTPCNNFTIKIPSICKYQKRYNDALKIFCEREEFKPQVHFVNPYADESPERLFLDDGHHLTVFGHKSVAKALSIKIREQLNMNNRT